MIRDFTLANSANRRRIAQGKSQRLKWPPERPFIRPQITLNLLVINGYHTYNQKNKRQHSEKARCIFGLVT